MANADRCTVCDRAECKRGTPPPPEFRVLLQRALDSGGKVTAKERATIDRFTDAAIAADRDCEKRRVDWRARALAAEAAIAAAIADWLVSQFDPNGSTAVVWRSIAEAIRSGAWRSLSTPGAKEPTDG